MKNAALAAGACLLVTGCSASGTSPTVTNAEAGASARPLTYPPEAGTIYVSNTNNSNIAYFALHGKHRLLGTIQGSPLQSPTGMAVAGPGNLYVATGAYEVLVYTRGSNYPSETLSDPGYFANAVAVGSDGTVYVANLFRPLRGSRQGPGNVLAYAPGSTEPNKVLTDPHFFYVTGVAVNKAGDLYVSYDEGTAKDPTRTGRVAEFSAGRIHAKEIIKVPGPRDNSGVDAIALDAHGNVVIAAYGTASFYVYPRAGGKKPLRSFSSGTNGIAEGIAFDSTGRTLFSTELASTMADVFDYKSGMQIGTIDDTSTSQYGIAVDPPLKNPR